MPRKRNPIPTYRLHSQSGQAVSDYYDPVSGRKRTVSLGRYDSPESRREHARLVAELAAGRPAGRTDGVTLNELFLAFLRHAEQHYRRPDGTITTELKNYKLALRVARETHGHVPAAEFGPLALKAVRKRMVEMGWCRRQVNKQVGRLRHVFKWAAGEELVPAAVYEGLKAVGGLQAGRTEARETAPVQPVTEADYLAALPYLPRVPRAIVEFMRFTGCRPGEACGVTLNELDRTGELWVYRPGRHKTRHHGKGRSIVIGPNGQAALLRFLAGRVPAPVGQFDPTHPVQRLAAAAEYERHHRPVDAALLRDLDRPVVVVAGYVTAPATPLFDPARDRLERFAEMRKNRKSKVTPCQVSRKKANPKVVPRTEYNPEALHHAVERAAVKAGVQTWHPNQLRHLRATEVRRLCGLEAAQVVLGHTKADVTQVYAERNDALAATVAKQIG